MIEVLEDTETVSEVDDEYLEWLKDDEKHACTMWHGFGRCGREAVVVIHGRCPDHGPKHAWACQLHLDWIKNGLPVGCHVGCDHQVYPITIS